MCVDQMCPSGKKFYESGKVCCTEEKYAPQSGKCCASSQVVTKDGKPSAHFEHTVLATDGEPIMLTTLIE